MGVISCVCTMGSKIESGIQLFSRLSHRPSVANLCPVLFSEDGPLPSELVEITGSSGSGKTLLLTDLLARCLLPAEYKGINLPGRNCGAVLINTDHHFSVLKLINVMDCILKRHSSKVVRLSQSSTQDVIKSCLKNLVVLNCYDSLQLQMTLHSLERIVSENTNISAVMVDGISSYYWEYRKDNGIISLQSYHSKILNNLLTCAKNSNVVVLFTKRETSMKTTKDSFAQHISYKVILNECEKKFQAVVINKSGKNTIPYTIEDTITFCR